METLIIGGIVTALLLVAFIVASTLRRVVSTNEVHIVQSSGKTMSYGKDSGNGNSYYEWPSFLPVLGVTRTTLPMSVFDLDLQNYEAYDKGRLPFVVDVKAFFRIADSNIAAQRVQTFTELQNQLRAIVQGAVRVILASNDIETILQGRSTFGDQFTKEVAEQLTHWGVSAVKNIELMDIRDTPQSHVIKNIMDKKKSHIEMESRTEVAKNMQAAQIAEIEAKKHVDMQAQAAAQAVGLKTIESQQQVELQAQTKYQAVKEQERATKEKEMAVLKVAEVRKAEILKEVNLVNAEQQRQTAVIKAQTERETTILTSEGTLEATKRQAEGITLEGTARAEAEKALQLAPVQAQITLAKEIGTNEGYQNYLVTIKKVEATQAVGMEQAKALAKADIKVISNTGTPTTGLTDVMDLFSSKGGLAVGSMLEGLANTEKGSNLLDKLVGGNKK